MVLRCPCELCANESFLIPNLGVEVNANGVVLDSNNSYPIGYIFDITKHVSGTVCSWHNHQARLAKSDEPYPAMQHYFPVREHNMKEHDNG